MLFSAKFTNFHQELAAADLIKKKTEMEVEMVQGRQEKRKLYEKLSNKLMGFSQPLIIHIKSRGGAIYEISGLKCRTGLDQAVF